MTTEATWLEAEYTSLVARLRAIGELRMVGAAGGEPVLLRQSAGASVPVLVLPGGDVIEPGRLRSDPAARFDLVVAAPDRRLFAATVSAGGSERARLVVFDRDGRLIRDVGDVSWHSPVGWRPDGSGVLYFPADAADPFRRVLSCVALDGGPVPLRDLGRAAQVTMSVGRNPLVVALGVARQAAATDRVVAVSLDDECSQVLAEHVLPTGGVRVTAKAMTGGLGITLVHHPDRPCSAYLVDLRAAAGVTDGRPLFQGSDETRLTDACFVPGVDGGSFAFVQRGVGGDELYGVPAAGGPAWPVAGVGRGTLIAPVATGRPDELLVAYEDFGTPTRVYRQHLRSGASEPAARLDERGVPDVRHRLLRVPAGDGEWIPVHELTPAGDATDPDGPVLVSMYGGFGVAETPRCAATNLAWIARGHRCVLVCPRGGSERGPGWHEAGRGRRKGRGLTDLVEAIGHLQDTGRLCAATTVAFGASHGGTLLASAVLSAPDRFRAAAIVAAPLDLLRLDTHVMGRLWRHEFGDSADPDDAAALRAVSPLSLVRPGGRYPDLLLLASSSDERVPVAQSRDFADAVRAAHPDNRVTLRDPQTAHVPRTADTQLRMTVEVLAFLEAATGRK
ncbi:S9 family peptidase [Dactylosporangium vinaceum]|uniref:prolyl oligopeptidase n=1 Tax=Dactylosporangium vinaceum TaxID=53362 RepID=A0ABV5MD44_9ACTN|nr:prolyl oligopeptidase family serine peptidase [Dactylosporangium vinaceum]UAC00826.1 S9 family peptidase [Dactylosporangium vinaceum]